MTPTTLPPAPTFPPTMASFQTGFTTLNPWGGAYPTSGIPYWYCATEACAQALQAHLATLGIHVAISQDIPLIGVVFGGIQQLNPAGQPALVPYLDFTVPSSITDQNPTGLVHVNAGNLADEYFATGNVRLIDYNVVNFWYQGAQ